jgi:hypothetical protein
MGKRKSYKRRSEFTSEEQMHRAVEGYHLAVVHDLLDGGKGRLSDRWKRLADYPSFQRTRLLLGSGEYNLTTTFSEHGSIEHTLDKVGATNHLVRAPLLGPV